MPLLQFMFSHQLPGRTPVSQAVASRGPMAAVGENGGGLKKANRNLSVPANLSQLPSKAQETPLVAVISKLC